MGCRGRQVPSQLCAGKRSPEPSRGWRGASQHQTLKLLLIMCSLSLFRELWRQSCVCGLRASLVTCEEEYLPPSCLFAGLAPREPPGAGDIPASRSTSGARMRRADGQAQRTLLGALASPIACSTPPSSRAPALLPEPPALGSSTHTPPHPHILTHTHTLLLSHSHIYSHKPDELSWLLLCTRILPTRAHSHIQTHIHTQANLLRRLGSFLIVSPARELLAGTRWETGQAASHGPGSFAPLTSL